MKLTLNYFYKFLLLTLLVLVKIGVSAQSLPGDSLKFGPMLSPVYNNKVRVWVMTKVGTGAGQVLSISVTPQGGGPALTGTLFNSDTRLGYELRSYEYTGLQTSVNYDAKVLNNGIPIPGKAAVIKTGVNQVSDFEFLSGGCGRIFDMSRCVDQYEAQSHTNGDPIMFKKMAAEGSDLMVWTGDATYLLGVEHAGGTCPGVVDDWGTKDDAFKRYSFYRGFHDSLCKAMPQLSITDNHDTGGNEFYNNMPTLGMTRQVFKEWWPNPEYLSNTQGNGLYSSYKYKDVEYFLLDNRSYRQSTSLQLGTEQMNWLKNGLLNSTATYKVIIAGTPVFSKAITFFRAHCVTAEGADIVKFIQDNKINGVLAYSADMHTQNFTGRYDDTNYPLFDGVSGNINSDVSNSLTINHDADIMLQSGKHTYMRTNLYGSVGDRRMKIEYVDNAGLAYYTAILHEDMLKSVADSTLKLYMAYTNSLKDSSKYNRTVTVSNISYVNDKNSTATSALGLSATSSVMFPYSNELSMQDRTYSISYWINPSVYPASNYAAVFSNMSAGAGYTIGINPSGNPVFKDFGTNTTYTATGIVPLNQWSQWLWTYDNVKRQLKVYKDGILMQAWSGVITPVNSTANLYIGSEANTNKFTGAIDEFRIYGKIIAIKNVCMQVTGSAFGTSPAYAEGFEYDKAFDGNTSTAFDFSGASNGYTGLDLGTAQVVTGVSFYPRAGNAGRMVGGKFQGSNTSSSAGFVDLYTIPTQPTTGWNNASFANTTAYRYYRYLSPANGFCNVAEIQFCGSFNIPPTVSITAPANNTTLASPANITINATAADADGTISKVEFYNGTTLLSTSTISPYTYSWTNVLSGTYSLTAKAYDNNGTVTTSSSITVVVSLICTPVAGTAFGTGPAYSVGAEFDKAFDGNINTYDDDKTASGGYTGLTLGTAQVVTGIRYYPRTGNAGRMTGGKFQGSNTSTSAGFVDLYTIPTAPTYTWQEVGISNTTAYKYYRYLSPTNGYTNVAEIQFCGQTTITPTINFNNLTKVYGDAPFAMTATSNSPGAMTYSITSGASFASINASTGQVIILGAGTVTVQVSQAASGFYTAATQTATLTINKAALTATADAKSRVYNTADPAFTITYSGFVNGDNASVVTTAPTASTAATISSNVGTYPIILAGGTAANYTITLVNGTLTITQATPNFTFTAPTSGIVGETINLSATTSSTGSVTYSVSNGTGTATLSGSTLTLNTAGTVTVTITIAASGNYSAATYTQTITINSATTPTITYNDVTKVYGDASFVMSATSTSPGAITYSITSGNSFATIDAVTGQVSILGAGTVIVQASQAPSGSYAAATKTATLTINKATPTLTYTGETSGITGSAITVAAATNSDASPVFTLVNGTGTATLSGITLTLGNVGTVTVTVSLAATTNYNAASINQAVTINSLTNPTVTINFATTGGVGETISLSVNSNSPGAVTYTVSNGTGSAELIGTQLNLTSAGTVTVTVSIAASGSYGQSIVTQVITISGATAIIAGSESIFRVYPNSTIGDAVIEIRSMNLGEGTIVVTDMNGIDIISIPYHGESELKLNSSSWTAGTYLIKLQTKAGERVTKLVKQ